MIRPVIASQTVATAHLPQMPEVVVVEDASETVVEGTLVQPEIVLRGNELRRKREANLGDTLSQELGVTSSSFGPGAGRPI
ncbi:MAG: TonB-dependent receptor, partial [Betaproteobacteria bacterium]|nr:TonB-dependent receptor [Betaproteobacteria bacterium]